MTVLLNTIPPASVVVVVLAVVLCGGGMMFDLTSSAPVFFAVDEEDQNDPSSDDFCSAENSDRLLKSIFKSKNGQYKKEELPPGKPLNVKSYIYIIDISGVHGSYMDVVMAIHLNWTDPRVKLAVCQRSENMTRDGIPVPEPYWDQIFIPPIGLYNVPSASTLKAPVPLKIIHVNPATGSIFNFQVVTARLPCRIDLRNTPYDQLECDLSLGSAWPVGHLIVDTENLDHFLSWDRSKIMLKDFEPQRSPFECKEHTFGDGYYDQQFIECTIKLNRIWNSYILQGYMTDTIIILFGWYSLWFPVEHVRISMLSGALITLIFQYSGEMKGFPRVGYVTGMDIWFAFCAVFIFALATEYCYLAYIARRRFEYATATAAGPTAGDEKGLMLDRVEYLNYCNRCDKLTRIVSGLAFVVFCVTMTVCFIMYRSK